jgi:hypothetical protein
MASAFIVSRPTKTGRNRFAVRYWLGGRTWPVQHGGSFQTQKEAKKRRDVIAGEIAAGRNPADLLATIATVPEAAVTVSEWRDRFLASRLDLDENTIRNYRVALKKACERFGDTDPAKITWQDLAEWIGALAETHKPGTIRLYKTHFSVLLDYIGLDPNPAKGSRVKVPKRVAEEPNPPTAEHFLAILDAIPQMPRRVLFLVMEQGALRLGEAVGALGRRRPGWPAVAPTEVGDEARPGPLGLPAQVAHGGPRGSLPAGRPNPGAAGFPGHHRSVRLPDHAPRLQGRWHSALPPARSTP